MVNSLGVCYERVRTGVERRTHLLQTWIMKPPVALMLVSLLAAVAARADLRAEVSRLVGPGEVVYVVDERDRVLLDIGGDQPFIPASILKLFTTRLAAERLGLDFRFTTEFYLDGDLLVVRGQGDPYLISEELDRSTAELARRLGDRALAGVVVDDSFFAPHMVVPGEDGSDNPYNALNTATGVNFNTISVRREGGTIVSAEPQTPLTPLAARLARGRDIRAETRINLGSAAGDAARYASELIAAKLRQAGVRVGNRAGEGRAPAGAPLYVHENSRTLADVCREMLFYSNNYVANQIFLVIGARAEGPPASLAKSVAVADRFVAAHPELRDIRVTEGSGLSYDNRVTAPAMAALLKELEPYRSLLRRQDGIAHKTGTLQATRTLAGYLDTTAHGTVRFVIRLDGARSDRRWPIVERLRRELGG